MKICMLLQMFAAVFWNGEEFPATDAEATAKGYVVLIEGDSTNPRESSYVTGSRWSDERLPHADGSYFNAKGYLLSPNAGADTYEGEDGSTRINRVFYGKRLVFANEKMFAPCGYGNSPTGPITTGTDGLFSVNGGGIINWSGNGACIQGPFTILNDGESVFHVYSQPNGATAVQKVSFFGDWRSHAEAVSVFTRNPVPSVDVGRINFFLFGGFDEYHGVLAVETNCSLTVTSGLPKGTLQLGLEGYNGKNTTGLAPSESGLNGEFHTAGGDGETLLFKKMFSNGGTLVLNPTNSWKVGELKLNAGVLEVGLGDAAETSRITVTNELSFVGKPVRLNITETSDSDGRKEWVVIDAPTGSFVEGDFDISGTALECAVVDDGQRARLTVLRRQTVKSVAKVKYKDGNNVYSTHFDSATDADGVVLWSDGKAPVDPEIDYVLCHDGGMPCNENSLDPFAGHSLTLAKNVVLYSGNNTPRACGMNVPDLRIENGVKMSIWSGSNRAGEQRYGKTTFRIQGGLTVAEGATASFNPYGGKFLRIESSLYGEGTLKLTTIDTVATTSAYGYHELSAYNTDFKGRILVTHPGLSSDAPSETLCTTLYIDDGRNLGAGLSAFMYDALRLEQMSVLKPSVAEVSLSQKNRGVFVSGCARFDIPDGYRFSVISPLTLNGELRKEGSGVLRLGGPLRFAMNDDLGESGTPSESLNLVRVLAGSVTPLATNAFDGAEMRFADGTTLLYEFDPVAPGMKEYGPFYAKWSVPLSLEPGAGASRVAVRFAKGEYGENPPDSLSLALGTFASDSDAAAFLEKISCVSPWRKMGIEISQRNNSDGTVTMLCSFYRKGLCIILR